MARLTASDFVAMARQALGGVDSGLISDARILRLINMAQIEIAQLYTPSELETSTTISAVSGTAEYETTATDILKVLTVVDSTNYMELKEADRSWYDRATQGNPESGTPSRWFESGVGSNSRKQFTFWPTPDGSYTITITYTKMPTEVVTSPTATSSILNQAWDDTIFHLAVARGWMWLGQDRNYDMWKREAQHFASLAFGSTARSRYDPHEASSILSRKI